MREKLDRILRAALKKCIEEKQFLDTEVPNYVIEIPNNPDHGHFATNLPMTLASSQKRPPRAIAEILAKHLNEDKSFIDKVEIAGPGFINFTLSKKEWFRFLETVVSLKDDYGRSDLGAGEKIMIEFVSANPTGPLHLGHGRGAALGDTLCRILSFTGFEVGREFYINDAGQQIRLLGESIYSRWKQMSDPEYPFPENGYYGDYISDLAGEISGKKDLESMTADEIISLFAESGKEIMLEEIRKDLDDFGVSFDVWYKESDIYANGLLDQSLEAIKKRGKTFEKDGAVWIKTSSFGDDKDRVFQKSDGLYTYFASDIAYHLDKWKRGFTKVVNIWGADHHGYVQRMKAAMQANGIGETWFTALLIQLVKLWRGGQEIRMSKRAGKYVTLKELVDEVGVDAVRFVFLTKNHDSPIDFDIDIVKKQDSENPVYYVQYAHARICSIFRKAAGEGVTLGEVDNHMLQRLALDEEMTLIRTMAEFPPLLEDVSKNLEPHRLTYYLTNLASLFHRYFNLGNKEPANRIVVSDEALCQARLFLAEAVRIVLANGLRLLGIHAPEKM